MIRGVLDRPGPSLVTLTGPRGRGKTTILSEVLRGREALHFQAGELTERELLRDFQGLAHLVLGEAPTPQRPGVLPVPTGPGSWLSLLMGIVDRVEASGRPMVLALDGMEPLLAARRKLGGVLAEAFQSARGRRLPLTLVLVARDPRTLQGLAGPGAPLGPADLDLPVASVPYRVAGWGHGGKNARDAFQRWAIFGDHPAHLPRGGRATGLEEAVVSRVLLPGGDLFEAPLRRLETTFQRPARYAAVLRALARGPLDWSGILARVDGIESGGQLAPYLRRLEEEGLVRADLPLDAKPASRMRRYSLSDPLTAFWFGWVLPHRSAVSALGARRVWRAQIQPDLAGHFQNWMSEAARRWLRDHASEVFGAPAREVGSIWGESVDFPVAGRLASGQICFGLVDWAMTWEGIDREMVARMGVARYGIGREARTPVFFLAGEASESVRRLVARAPLSSVVGIGHLMGDVPPG